MDKYDDIKIENLCYNFADFDFYYKSEGDNAGIVILLEEKFKEYFDKIYKKAESEGLDPTHFEKYDIITPIPRNTSANTKNIILILVSYPNSCFLYLYIS